MLFLSIYCRLVPPRTRRERAVSSVVAEQGRLGFSRDDLDAMDDLNERFANRGRSGRTHFASALQGSTGGRRHGISSADSQCFGPFKLSRMFCLHVCVLSFLTFSFVAFVRRVT